MKFRPCIDLHSGKVKQIVGSTLSDAQSDSSLKENFATDRPASEFAAMYKADNLYGGHVIMLGPGNDEAARAALAAFPGGLQVGGGVTKVNARKWLELGASHVIVTSAVFRGGKIDRTALAELVALVGRERLVLDLSCRRRPQAAGARLVRGDGPLAGPYYVVTDRWQKFTDVAVDAALLRELAESCAEFLVHGVDVEGMRCGVLEDLIALLGEHSPIPVT